MLEFCEDQQQQSVLVQQDLIRQQACEDALALPDFESVQAAVDEACAAFFTNVIASCETLGLPDDVYVVGLASIGTGA